MPTCPLSYGQLSEWRNVDSHPRERWHEANTWSRWLLPDGVKTSAVRGALRALATRHLSLRTIYDFTDPACPRQLLGPVDGADLTEAECATPEEDAALSNAALNRPFDLRVEVGWRAQIRTRRGRPTEVLLVRHHIVADNWSDAVLEQDFFAYLRYAAPTTPAPTPLDLATWQRSQERTRAAATAYWQGIFASGDGRGFPGSDPTRTGQMQCTLRSRLAYLGAHELATRTRTSLSNVVLAAYTLAVAQITGITRLVAHSMCANRFHPQWRHTVTSMSQYAAIPLTLLDDLAEQTVQVYRAAMVAYRHSMYDPDTIAGFHAEHEPTCTYNFFPWQDITGPPTDDPEPVWEEPASTVSGGCYLRAAEDTGRTLKLRLMTNGIERERVAWIMKQTHALLVG
jgi:hypothetical protein